MPSGPHIMPVQWAGSRAHPVLGVGVGSGPASLLFPLLQSPAHQSYVSNAWRSICFFWGVRQVGNWMSKKMKRSPFLVGSSGNGIPSPGTFLKYLGLRREDERRGLGGHPRAAHPPLPRKPQAWGSQQLLEPVGGERRLACSRQLAP